MPAGTEPAGIRDMKVTWTDPGVSRNQEGEDRTSTNTHND